MTTVETESVFVRRLAAAVRAAWWTFLVGVVAATVQFFIYYGFSHSLWFPDFMSNVLGLTYVSGDTLLLLILGFMLAIRLILAAWLLGTLFLTLWLRRLRRLGDR